MMEMIVTLYVPRTAPLAAALEEKAARAVRGGLPGAPCAVCGEQSRGQKDVHVKAQTGRAGRPAGDESAHGVWDCADEGADGMRNGVHTGARAGRAGRCV